MDNAIAYLPMDRRHALAHGQILPDRTHGAALFADISGFTPLTEAMVAELGPKRGAEELTHYLNLVYDAVIDELHRYGGSGIAFAGDAVTSWFDGDDGRRATACALAMQHAMQQFRSVRTPAGNHFSLAIKTAVTAGPARRFLVGDPALRVIDALAGETVTRLSLTEHQAQKGETVIDGDVWDKLGDLIEVKEIRHAPEQKHTVVVVRRLRQPVAPTPWALVPADALPEEQVRRWLLPSVYERLRHGQSTFLTELRPTVPLLLRFGKIDYDNDDQAGEKLDAYIRWVQGVVAHYEGTLIDFNIGDKGNYLYINFGAPLAHENNADRAAAAALALRDQPEALHYIGQVQIGISQGRMRAGAYGGAEHRTYGVLGDEVNLAARLMMAAQPGQILVSQAARQSMGKNFIFEDLPPMKVKGKREPVVVFTLAYMRLSQEFHHTTAIHQLPLIGRQAELAVLVEKLRLASQGEGQIVGITSKPGLGKSRLVAEIAHLASHQQFASFGGECESYGLNSSYLVWQSIWRGLLEVDATGSSAQQITALAEKLRTVNPGLLPRMPLLHSVLNIDIPDTPLTQSITGKLRKALLETMLVDYLRSVAAQTPCLIVLESCQWLDSLSHDLLESIGKAISNLPVLLLLTYRPVELERLRAARLSRLPHFSEIALPSLTASETTEFVQAKTAQLLGKVTPVSASLVERIAQEAEGNPFYLKELLTYLHVRGVDFADAAALDKVELPDSLQRLVLSLLDQLSESQQITIKVASVVGRIFRAAWLHGACPELGEPGRVQADLSDLHQQEMLFPEPTGAELVYLFRQMLTQSVTYESLPHQLKLTLHEQIGNFIELNYPDTLEQYLDLLAHHYDRSAQMDKQRHYLLKAGEAAQAEYANEAAIDYFTRLLPLLLEHEQGDVLLKLGQVLETVGDYEQADQRFQRAMTVAEQNQDQPLLARCQIALGELRRKQSRYEEASHYFALAQSVAEQSNDLAGMAKALVCAGSLALYQGEYATAQHVYSQSLTLRRQLGDQPNIANVLNNLAITAANQGLLDQALELFAESLSLRRALRDKWGVTNSLNNLGELALLKHAYDQARTYLTEAVTNLREIGDKWSLGNSLVNLGNALRSLGELAAAYPLYQESLQINRDLGDRWMIAYLLENIGVLQSLRGDALSALQLAGVAAALRETIGTPLSPTEEQQLTAHLHPARQALSEEAATNAWAIGRTLPLAEAISLALSFH